MKILMLTPYLPYPPSSGGQVRSFNLIKNLAKDHQITLFSLIKDNNELKYVPELEKFCQKVKVFKRPGRPWTLKNILRTGFSLYPFLVIRNLVPEEKEAVEKELKKEDYDLIHAETFYVMPHIPKTKVPILLVEQTIEYQVYQHYVQSKSFWLLKQILNIDVAKIKLWETKFWQKANKVVAVSESDKRKMQSLVKGLDVDVVPNGAGEDLVSLWQENKKIKKVIVLFQANFLWLQNTEAAIDLVKRIFPLIKKKLPQGVCRIVGQEARQKLATLKGEGIEIINLDNEDIEGVKKAYRQATVFLAPLKGPGGTRLKILGAMAAGVPVVTTPVGIEGIEARDGVQVLVRKSEKELAETVVELIKNKKLYQRISQAARILIEKTYTYKAIAEVLERIYRQVATYGKN